MRLTILLAAVFGLSPTVGFATEPVSFQNDVMAVLSRAGCNAGACHGNLNGRGGFKLSLRGENPAGDFVALTRDMLARRTDVTNARESLLLRKAAGQLPHEGGARFSVSSTEYSLLLRWVEAGTQYDTASRIKPVKLDVTPVGQILVAPADRTKLNAVAHFADGSKRDVTNLVTFETNNVGVAKVHQTGDVVKEQDGEVVVLVRYLDLQVPVRLAFLPNRPTTDLSQVPVYNAIDRHVFAQLQQLRMTPSELCSDSVFIRRLYLDACGITPTADEVRKFLADTTSDKRVKLIDALLARPEFANYWAQKWSDLLRNEEKSLDHKGVQIFHRWIKAWIAEDKPLNDFAREILAGRGSTYANPPANFYRAIRDPYQRAESVAQVFLGLRVSCAKCHNHPFDTWTQDDYHRFVALFARIEYRVTDNVRRDDLDKHEFNGDQLVYVTHTGELPHPRGGNAVPKFLGSNQTDLDEDRVTALADWVASAQNPFFARAQANRIWSHLMARGLVEPNDDFRVSNPPINPALMDHLTHEFTSGGYRLKPFVRHVLNSRVYQLSASPNETNAADDLHYSHAAVQPLKAEQLLDALANTFAVPVKFPGYPMGMRAGEVPATPLVGRRGRDSTTGTRFLKVFGKPDRLLTCDCERSEDPGILQAFQLMTGELVHMLIRTPGNRIGQLLDAKAGESEMLEELYLNTLARTPTATESAKLHDYLQNAKDPRSAWEDIAWGLVNSKEFLLRR